MNWKSIFIVIATGFFFVTVSEGRTWRVEHDGSGDWLTIQPAVDAAATGDTIHIGPGHYNDFHPGPISSNVMVFLDVAKDLVFIGENRDEVVLGPDVIDYNTYGIWLPYDSSNVFRDLTFSNMFRGLVTGGDLVVSNCSYIYCDSGISSDGANFGEFSNCIFENNRKNDSNIGLAIWNSLTIRIENCEFIEMGIYMEAVDDFEIKNSVINNNFFRQGISCWYSNGLMEGLESRSTVGLEGSCNVVIRNSSFDGGEFFHAFFAGGGTVGAFDSIFSGGTYSTIQLMGNSSTSGGGNHFINTGAPHTVRLEGFNQTPSVEIDLRNNFWGTTVQADIENWIYDSNDDPLINTEVQFLPFSSDPLPVEGQSKSWGSFKAMFR